VVTNNVEIKKSENAGYGIFTTRSIKDTTEPLVFIPKKLLITVTRLLTDVINFEGYELLLTAYETIFNQVGNNINESVITSTSITNTTLKQSLQESKNEKLCLRLFLAFELYQSRQQQQQQLPRFWKPYIDVLPSLSFFQQHHVLFLQPDKTENPLFALLEGTSLASSIQAKQSKLTKEWNHLHQTYSSQVTWLKDLTMEDWFYIDALFWSRVVSLGSRKETDQDDDDDDHGEDLALIPYFDFANHQMIPNIRWRLIDDDNETDEKKKKEHGLQLISFINEDQDDDNGDIKKDTILEANQELCLSYGNKPNQELLFLHGFCLPDNPVTNQITLSFFPFLNPAMQDEESVLKWKWLQQQPSFKPLLIIHYTSPLQQQKPSFPTIDMFKETGFTFESICMMYLVALDQDDGLILEEEKEKGKENITEEIQKLSLEATNHTTVQLYFTGDDGVEKKENIITFEHLYHKVLSLPHADVIQLRVVTLIMNAIQYHLQQIEENDYLLESGIIDEDVEAALRESPLFIPIQTYRDEERSSLQRSLDALSNLSDTLMQSETVLEYLDYMNSMENDE
ncbi:hypothetical protein BJ944DRAFT_272854, partial [Cunninghamella echinulata]